jgi:hypothetical protein
MLRVFQRSSRDSRS